ncbi:MAG: helix-turn-helix domain-containing protein [Saprospiraceae bacterium]|nr:helix-turn-helix domain-containing protein [Saprospiraceae bacterium]
MCTGALILAKMGLLNGKNCTVQWKCLDYAKKNFPKAKFRDDHLYVFDKGIFTSGGMTCGIDMALALVEKWSNPLVSAEIAQEMVINIRRADTQNQKNTFLDFKNHFNAEVYKAQQLLANNLQSSYTLKNLAADLNRSERQISRLFKSHTGETIQQLRDKIRLDHGENLLRNTRLTIKEIANQCGYLSPRQFSRVWKARYGEAPKKMNLFSQKFE